MSDAARRFAPFVFVALLTACPPPTTPPAEPTHVEPVPKAHGATEQADAAFNAKQWEKAAIAYATVATAAAASAEETSRAELRLAMCFAELGLERTSSVMLGDIAGHPAAGTAKESFRALARLAVKLRSADLSNGLGAYPAALRDAALADLPAEARARARYELGRYERSQGKLDEAIAELEKVDGVDGARAQLLIALINVQKRLSVPAVKALENAEEKLGGTIDDERRALHDLSVLLQANTYFSAAIRAEPDRPKTFLVDRKKMAAAVSLADRVGPESPFYAQAQWQSASARATLQDFPGALRAIENVKGAPRAYVPEAELLEADVHWRTKQDKKARAALDAFEKKYTPVRDALLELEKKLAPGPESEALAIREIGRARASAGDLPEPLRRALPALLRDRDIERHMEDLAVIERERASFAGLSAELHESSAGAYARAALDAVQENLRQWLRATVEMRVTRARDELDELLRKAATARAESFEKKPVRSRP